MNIGPYQISSPLILAPMAGITDGIVRALCLEKGAGMAVGEMVTSEKHLYKSEKTRRRLQTFAQEKPKIVQIVGYDPFSMAEAAKMNADLGADVIDINMGCPAKKVCNKLAGSALLKDEKLVAEILESVVDAVQVPVTLKIRTGWDLDNKNAVRIASIAESAGIQALAVHGRTRACRFIGAVEYESIRKVKASVSIPVIANGDINSFQKAKFVLDYTKADAVMIGRAAQGNPWIFSEIQAKLRSENYSPPVFDEILKTISTHLENLYSFYGEYTGVRIARKHFAWYSQHLCQPTELRKQFNGFESAKQQISFLKNYKKQR